MRGHSLRPQSAFLGGLAALALVVGACAAPPPPAGAGAPAAPPSAATSATPAPRSVSFGVVGKSATTFPLYVADHKGFFAKYGTKIEFIITGSSASTGLQLTAGSLDMGESGLPDFIRPMNQGAPIVIVSGAVATPPYTLLARPAIKKISDLKGKTIVVGGPKDVTRFFIDEMMKKSGLGPNDYTLTYVGSTPDRFAALHASSGADATFLFPPFDFRAIGEGFTNLGTVQDVLPGFPFTGFAANRKWAEQNRTLLVGFLKANREAIDWLYDTKNRTEAAQILAGETKAAIGDAEKTYDLLLPKLKAYRTDLLIPEADFRQVLQALVVLGDMKEPLPPASQYIDDSYAKAATGGK